MVLSVAKDFSRFPAGRRIADGPYSGEVFLQEKLLPQLQKEDKLRIVLDGTIGYGSSFLDGAFGGLVRLKQWPLPVLMQKIELVSEEEPNLIAEIHGYMRDAANE
ncbi:MAG: STAS-like domain-containing protein [Neisseria sp.]|nr:STAS-like domain-containing protein [Neisseria sp.]